MRSISGGVSVRYAHPGQELDHRRASGGASTSRRATTRSRAGSKSPAPGPQTAPITRLSPAGDDQLVLGRRPQA